MDELSETDWKDACRIWSYHQLHHELRATSVAIGLGSHDIGVATFAADLYHRGLFPLLVFSGANSPRTAPQFPSGEANAFRSRAIELGVPSQAILVEPKATNTGQNIELSRQLLQDAGVRVDSVTLISMPGMERRAYATCRRVWPEVDVVCTSQSIDFDDYLRSFDDPHLVIDDLVGDLQRIIEYPRLGFAVPQEVPPDVQSAYERLVRSGFASRLLSV